MLIFLDSKKVLISVILFLFFVTIVYGEPGIDDKNIYIGISNTTSGNSSGLGNSLNDGISAYIHRHGNRVKDRQIVIIKRDDSYDPQLTIKNTEEFIASGNIFVLLGYVGTPTVYAVLNTIEEEKIPFFFPFTGASRLRNIHEASNVFNLRGSYQEEANVLLKYLSKRLKTKIALLYQADHFGLAVVDAVDMAIVSANLNMLTEIAKENARNLRELVDRLVVRGTISRESLGAINNSDVASYNGLRATGTIQQIRHILSDDNYDNFYLDAEIDLLLGSYNGVRDILPEEKIKQISKKDLLSQADIVKMKTLLSLGKLRIIRNNIAHSKTEGIKSLKDILNELLNIVNNFKDKEKILSKNDINSLSSYLSIKPDNELRYHTNKKRYSKITETLSNSGFSTGLDSFLLKRVVKASFKRDTTEVNDAVASIFYESNAGVDAVIMVGTYKPCAKFVQNSRSLTNRSVTFLTISFVGAHEFIRDFQDVNGANNVIVTQVVPLLNSGDQVISKYEEDMRTQFPNDWRTRLNFISLEGYLDAKLFLEILEASKELTRDAVIEAANNMKNIDIGVSNNPITFANDDHEGFDKVYITEISGGNFHAILP
ncbi:MAG: ABC transporter substrate-binding protein [Candidatus Magnetoovum sp. WYHC-5]|nr:ABC transporter substrate-binding protein [Candidatus Magnetoovum sp. WYHC-5]